MLSANEYRTILRHDLTSFIERSFYELNPDRRLSMGAYIEAMATKLEHCREGKLRRLIINLPPRYLKSHCASIAFPAWLLGHKPSTQIICASYGQDLSDKFARDCRNLMASRFYQALFPTRLSADRQAVHDYATTFQGSRFATSIGGVLTGRGADFIIVDDPLKPDEALSEQRRAAANEWFDNSLRSRLNDKETGCIIIVMQRLHQDDLVAHVQEQEPWEILSFPAIAEEDETHLIEAPLGHRYYRRAPGDVLDPGRDSAATFTGIRQISGDYVFSSQYQQNPIPVGGAMIKVAWLRFYDPPTLPRNFTRIVQSWDTANKSGELNDFSVCTTWGTLDKNFYLLNVFRKRLNYPELKRAVVEQAKLHNANTVLIEDKASGTQLIQELRSELYGITAYEAPKGMDKVLRLHAQADLFENGFVYLPSSAGWLTDYVHEITTFPGTKHDDQVDSTTQALDYLRKFDDLEVWAKLGAGPGFPPFTPSGPWLPLAGRF